MQGSFTMMLMCELPATDVDFEQVRSQLNELGQQLGVQIRIQREEIFDTMYKI
jgi:ACT domain-containing protein